MMGRISVGTSSEGDCLSLYAKQAFKRDEIIFRWPIESDTVMLPLEKFSDQLPSGDFGALAFQVLKATRSKNSVGPWAAWIDAGVKAPEEHPLKLLFSDMDLARRLWTSTTCGGRMSGAALQLRDDVELLGGSASLEEWAEAVALVMARTFVEDETARPVLVLGLDLLQDSDTPNVRADLQFTRDGGGAPFGFGGGGEEKLSEIALVATCSVRPGEELTTRYMPKPHGGKYLERYGFVPDRLQGAFAPSCAELSFAPTDEDDDPGFGVKQSLLEDRGMTTEPIPFLITTDAVFPPRTDVEWDDMAEIDRLAFMLRLRNMGEKESFLLDAVYVADAWDNCKTYISKDNEAAMCKMIIEECDRWLERFRAAEDAGDQAEEGSLLAAAIDIRKGEQDILERVRTIFQQELNETNFTETRQYWADRQLKTIFPERARREGSIWNETLFD